MQQILNTLYIQTQGAYVHLDHDTLKVEIDQETKLQLPLHHLGGIFGFGNVMVSPFLLHRCAADGRDFVWLSQHGRFQARLAGPVSGNVLLRRSQHQAVAEPAGLMIARWVIAGKLQNARGVLLRAAREAKAVADREVLTAAAKVHAEGLQTAKGATGLDQLRGVEGHAARAYFGAMTAMVRQQREVFEFTVRSKRPPKDPINALLSFAYTLLTNDCAAACEGVGLDPQMGFLHALRPGKPALALDLMEELRPLVADRLVLNLINRGQIKPEDFVDRPGGGVYLTEAGRKTFLAAYQKRKQEEVTHGVVGSKVPYGLVPHVQARLLARHLRGDLPEYPPFVLR
jgi:CRISP-associated protein Cas1